jgi:hypothetical protein
MQERSLSVSRVSAVSGSLTFPKAFDCLPVRGRPTGITPFFEACMNSVILFAVSKKRTIWFHLIEDYVDPILRAPFVRRVGISLVLPWLQMRLLR